MKFESVVDIDINGYSMVNKLRIYVSDIIIYVYIHGA